MAEFDFETTIVNHGRSENNDNKSDEKEEDEDDAIAS